MAETKKVTVEEVAAKHKDWDEKSEEEKAQLLTEAVVKARGG